MILIDSVFINNGGGLVLLKYLVDKLEEKGLDVVYLFDYRVLEIFNFLPKTRCYFIKNSILHRFIFYYSKKKEITSVLCFGNVPPPIKLNVPTYVYFHQKLFLDPPHGLPIRQKIQIKFKQSYIFIKRKNTTLWLVQSKSMLNNIKHIYCDGDKSKVLICSFYPPLNFKEYKSLVRNSNTFLYVSSGSSHKNHLKLIKAFCNVYNETKKGVLTLTVGSDFPELSNYIEKLSNEGYPIINIGNIPRENLLLYFQTTEFFIFPSLSESYGLGIIEAIEGGCKVIASNLPYIYDVCSPSLTFNPYDIESIEKAIKYSLMNEIPDSHLLTSNNIEYLIEILLS